MAYISLLLFRKQKSLLTSFASSAILVAMLIFKHYLIVLSLKWLYSGMFFILIYFCLGFVVK